MPFVEGEQTTNAIDTWEAARLRRRCAPRSGEGRSPSESVIGDNATRQKDVRDQDDDELSIREHCPQPVVPTKSTRQFTF